MKRAFFLTLLSLLFQYTAMAASYKIGIAKTKITPETPFWMTGYAARTVPSTGVLHDLWAKAIIIEERPGHRIVIITTDLLGLPRQISEKAANLLQAKFNITRSQIMFNSSHTHSGPMVWPNLGILADYTYEDQKKISAYGDFLVDKFVAVVTEAIGNMTDMQLSVGHTEVLFGMNRRRIVPTGVAHTENKVGVNDHDVPVLKITTPDGKVKGILFGYACHNTTIQADNTLINGDYAGFAQIALEAKYPDAVAMFVIGCAGDQNPAPRGTIELAKQHGENLAAEVSKLVDGKMRAINPTVQSTYSTIDLEFNPYPIDKYQKDMTSGDQYLQRRAKLMLDAYNRGWDITRYNYPIQAINFGNSFYIIALGGEPTVDYSLKLKQLLKNKDVFVAGYSNEVVCYIPSERVLAEGGYEAESNLIYYGMAGPFKPGLENKIITKAVADIKKISGSGSKK
ncbi:MAG: neutral/alkaline non-lysosomal ceramidase N-terminal domain-containing protein [Bacteroidota bacterium]